MDTEEEASVLLFRDSAELRRRNRISYHAGFWLRRQLASPPSLVLRIVVTISVVVVVRIAVALLAAQIVDFASLPIELFLLSTHALVLGLLLRADVVLRISD